MRRWASQVILLGIGTMAFSTISNAYASTVVANPEQNSIDAPYQNDGIELFQKAAPALKTESPFALPSPLQLDLVDRVNRMFAQVFEPAAYSEARKNYADSTEVSGPPYPTSTKRSAALTTEAATDNEIFNISLPGNNEATGKADATALHLKNIMYRTDI